MKRLACVLAGAFVLTGCGSVRYPANYLLDIPAPVPRGAASQAVLGTVAVREFRCPEHLCDGRIVYRPSPEEVGFYEYHRWATSPRAAITKSMADALRARPLFKSVAVHERGIEAAYVLTGSIDRLEEVDRGSDIRAVCAISAQLTEARSGSLIWTHSASEAVPVDKRNVTGLVNALSAAARTTVDRLVDSLASEVAAGPSVPASNGCAGQ